MLWKGCGKHMIKVSNQEYRESAEHYGYCDVQDDVLEITATRIWKLYVGGQVRFGHVDICCPCSSKCQKGGKCLLVKEAQKEWHEEAVEMLPEMTRLMTE